MRTACQTARGPDWSQQSRRRPAWLLCHCHQQPPAATNLSLILTAKAESQKPKAESRNSSAPLTCPALGSGRLPAGKRVTGKRVAGRGSRVAGRGRIVSPAGLVYTSFQLHWKCLAWPGLFIGTRRGQRPTWLAGVEGLAGRLRGLALLLPRDAELHARSVDAEMACLLVYGSSTSRCDGQD